MPIIRKANKQTIKKKNTQISPYRKLIQTTGLTLGGKKAKGRKKSYLNPGKGDLKHNKVKKKKKEKKRYHNTIQIITNKQNTRSTKMQIN